jgi:hypothetical protein
MIHFFRIRAAELEGAAYRNADFLKEFEDKGVRINAERAARLSADLTAL